MTYAEQLELRIEAMVGRHWQTAFARAIGRHSTKVNLQFRRDKVEVYVMVIVELMEACPIDRWPVRFDELRGRAEKLRARRAVEVPA